MQDLYGFVASTELFLPLALHNLLVLKGDGRRKIRVLVGVHMQIILAWGFHEPLARNPEEGPDMPQLIGILFLQTQIYTPSHIGIIIQCERNTLPLSCS